MNFLAHIYLSNEDPQIKIGNFIADSIRGKDYLKYPQKIQYGVLLHRQIDSFTDSHPIVKKSKQKLYKNYRHYAGVIVDILYDHFLAKNWNQYSNTPLEIYTSNFYDLLEENFELLPSATQHMIPYMIQGNWLVSYASIEGIAKVLEGMNRRTKNRSKMNLAIGELQEYYTDFEEEFTLFFEELKKFSYLKLNEIITK